MLGRDPFPAASWETRLFSRFVEAFETTAAQRGAARWEPGRGRVSPIRGSAIDAPDSALYPIHLGKLHPESSPHGITQAAGFAISTVAEPDEALRLLRFDEIGGGAFRTHLPLAASLAAGSPFHGFEAEDLAALEAFDWVEVPPRLAKERRFVVRVAGDSMEPTLQLGDLVVIEYHRTPRRPGQIVIANLPAFGRGTTGIEAIKRIQEDRDHWIFESDHPDYEPIRIEKGEIGYPILGTMVEVLRGENA